MAEEEEAGLGAEDAVFRVAAVLEECRGEAPALGCSSLAHRTSGADAVALDGWGREGLPLC